MSMLCLPLVLWVIFDNGYILLCFVELIACFSCPGRLNKRVRYSTYILKCCHRYCHSYTRTQTHTICSFPNLPCLHAQIHNAITYLIHLSALFSGLKFFINVFILLLLLWHTNQSHSPRSWCLFENTLHYKWTFHMSH